MKLSEVLRLQAALAENSRYLYFPLSNSQWVKRERIFRLFDEPGRIWGWNMTAKSGSHRTMILLFAAAIAESEGD